MTRPPAERNAAELIRAVRIAESARHPVSARDGYGPTSSVRGHLPKRPASSPPHLLPVLLQPRMKYSPRSSPRPPKDLLDHIAPPGRPAEKDLRRKPSEARPYRQVSPPTDRRPRRSSGSSPASTGPPGPLAERPGGSSKQRSCPSVRPAPPPPATTTRTLSARRHRHRPCASTLEQSNPGTKSRRATPADTLSPRPLRYLRNGARPLDPTQARTRKRLVFRYPAASCSRSMMYARAVHDRGRTVLRHTHLRRGRLAGPRDGAAAQPLPRNLARGSGFTRPANYTTAWIRDKLPVRNPFRARGGSFSDAGFADPASGGWWLGCSGEGRTVSRDGRRQPMGRTIAYCPGLLARTRTPSCSWMPCTRTAMTSCFAEKESGQARGVQRPGVQPEPGHPCRPGDTLVVFWKVRTGGAAQPRHVLNHRRRAA